MRAAERYRLMGLVDRWVLQTTFTALGRGAITVDTTDSSSGDGHPYWYLTQEQLNQLGDNDASRMVAAASS